MGGQNRIRHAKNATPSEAYQAETQIEQLRILRSSQSHQAKTHGTECQR